MTSGAEGCLIDKVGSKVMRYLTIGAGTSSVINGKLAVLSDREQYVKIDNKVAVLSLGKMEMGGDYN